MEKVKGHIRIKGKYVNTYDLSKVIFWISLSLFIVISLILLIIATFEDPFVIAWLPIVAVVFVPFLLISVLVILQHDGFIGKSSNTAQMVTLPITKEQRIEREKQQKDLYKRVKESIKPNGKTIRELEEVIVNQFGGRIIEVNEHELISFKLNLVINKVMDPAELKDSKEDFRIKANRILDDGIVLDIVVYEFDEIDSNGYKPRLEIERRYEYFTMSNGDRNLWNDIIIAYGVYEEDIDDETVRFHGYAYALEARKNIQSDE